MQRKGVRNMKCKKKVLSALVALGLAFGGATVSLPSAEAASVDTISKISVKADGSNFKYWNQNSASFKALKAYVEDVTNPKSPNFIPVKDRVCVSDMDGTFYGELAPTYSEWYMYFHRIFNDKSYHPTATEKAYAEECLKAAKANKISADMDAGEDMAQARAFEGMSLQEFDAYVAKWLKETPCDGLSNLTMAEAYYLPMIEVITYLQANGFNFYVVTGTDRQMVRTALKAVPSIQPDHVIGTDSISIAARQGFAGSQYFRFEKKDKMMRGAYQATNNKMQKVSNICREIGIRPVLALGNSSSDASMLNYAVFNDKYKSMAMGVNCDDGERDWGGPKKSKKFHDLCVKFGWVPISMHDDWKTIYGDNVKKTTQNFRK